MKTQQHSIPDVGEGPVESLADITVDVPDDVIIEDSECRVDDIDAAGLCIVDDDDTDVVELIDNSSCRFFSYSVCFPCCISSFVKLAASSPKIIVIMKASFNFTKKKEFHAIFYLIHVGTCNHALGMACSS